MGGLSLRPSEYSTSVEEAVCFQLIERADVYEGHIFTRSSSKLRCVLVFQESSCSNGRGEDRAHEKDEEDGNGDGGSLQDESPGEKTEASRFGVRCESDLNVFGIGVSSWATEHNPQEIRIINNSLH